MVLMENNLDEASQRIATMTEERLKLQELLQKANKDIAQAIKEKKSFEARTNDAVEEHFK